MKFLANENLFEPIIDYLSIKAEEVMRNLVVVTPEGVRIRRTRKQP